MPIVSTKEILDRAFADRYGVAAFNILDDLTIDAVLAAAEEERAPVILQTSVKTVRAYGRDRLISVFRAMAQDTTVPVAVHLDHCPYRDVITECLDAGWNSVLFDAHELDVADNLAQTIEVVAEAGEHGAAVEGEIEGIEGIGRTTSAPTRHPNCRAWRPPSTSSAGPVSTSSLPRSAWDPPTLFAHQRATVVATAREHIALFGGSGKAW